MVAKAVILAIALCLLPLVASAQQQTSNLLANGTGDPCSQFPHSSVPINFASTTSLTQEIPLVAGQAIYVCSMNFVTAATSTFQIEYGTGTNCGTGTTALTGTYLSSSFVITPANSSLLTTPVGQALCMVTTGATGAANGWLAYVQF